MWRLGTLLLVLVTLCALTTGEEALSKKDKRIELFVQINNFRVSEYKEVVFNNSVLFAIAQSYTEDMVTRKYFGVRNPENKPIDEMLTDKGYVSTMWSISVVEGVLDPKKVLTHLKNDDVARPNILDDDAMEMGVGFSEKKGKWTILLATRIAECGNGVVDHSEECDDGNTQSDDCCSDNCRVEVECICLKPNKFQAASLCRKDNVKNRETTT